MGKGGGYVEEGVCVLRFSNIWKRRGGGEGLKEGDGREIVN